jgi:hypothetical protein
LVLSVLLQNAKLFDSVIFIGKRCFSDYILLEVFDIPKSVISISENCFAYCSSLISNEILSSIREIGKERFLGCLSRQNVSSSFSISNEDNCFKDSGICC